MSRHDFKFRIFRAAAVFLLLFTAADLTLAEEWCGEERSPIASTIQLAAQSNEPAQQAPDDDCFCCCGHVDVTAPYSLIAIAYLTSAPNADSDLGLIAPAPPTFPPPRSA